MLSELSSSARSSWRQCDSATHLSGQKVLSDGTRKTVGKNPQLVFITINRYDKDQHLNNEFMDNPQFTVQSGNGLYHLHISNTQPSVSTTYFYGAMNVNVMKFKNGIFLILKGGLLFY